MMASVCRFIAGLRACLVGVLVGSGGIAAAAPLGATTILWGVNDSGLDFGHGAIQGRNFVVPDPAYYLSRGVRLVRIPFEIVRIQPVAGGPLAPQIVGDLRGIIAEDSAEGAITVLDPHGYGFYPIDGKPQDILKNPAAASGYVDLMRRIALEFAQDDVAIGLMNEPHTGPDSAYAPVWNQAIAAMRQAGFHGVILVPHAHWSAAADIGTATPFAGAIVDPDRNWVLELHAYLDPDGSGTYRKPVASAAVGAARLAGAIAWSRQSGIRLFLGETGGPADPVAIAALQTMLAEIDAAPDVFWGAALWGGGPWWKPDYPMRLDPIDGVDRPQFVALEAVMAPEIFYFARDAGGPDPKIVISIDGKAIGPAVTVTALRHTAPQAVPVRSVLAAGSHTVSVRCVSAPGSGAVYIVDSAWKGVSDSAGSFRALTNHVYVFQIRVPG
jgi:endoglucanase